MKDSIITSKQKKNEIWVFGLSIAAALIINIIAIRIYHTQWSELYSQWYVVLLLGLFIYGLSWGIRLVFIGLKLLLKKRK